VGDGDVVAVDVAEEAGAGVWLGVSTEEPPEHAALASANTKTQTNVRIVVILLSKL
jgi:hypothetical protein